MTGIQARRTRHKEMLRQDILDAARDLFATEGYENVSMRKIAERIDYSPTIIYHYFKDKSELLYHLVDETFSKLLKTLYVIRTEEPDPLRCLKKSGQAYIEFGLKHPNHYRVAFMLPINPQNEQEKARYLSPQAMGIMTFNFLGSLVAACINEGKFRDTGVEITAQYLFAVVHGLTALLITHPEFPWVNTAQLIDHTLDSAINSLQG